jgi:tetratricopeptide (TPR) repeat protein
LKEAIAAYEAALRLRPNSIATMVNASLAYNRAGRNSDAERVLRQALRQSPRNVEAGTNLGLLLAETGRNAEAETVLQNAVDADPSAATAAYNLCLLEAKERPANALANCRAAVRAQPQNETYSLALAFYLRQQGDRAGAIQTLENLLRANPRATRAAYSLGKLHLEAGNKEQAAKIWQRILDLPELPAGARARITQRLRELNQ